MTTTKRRPAGRQTARLTDVIRQTIAARGLTPYAVAKESGLSTSVVDRFLRGERGLNSQSLDAVAGALGLRLVAGADGLKGRPKRAKRKAGAEPI